VSCQKFCKKNHIKRHYKGENEAQEGQCQSVDFVEKQFVSISVSTCDIGWIIFYWRFVVHWLYNFTTYQSTREFIIFISKGCKSKGIFFLDEKTCQIR
jgi:hypothetical protein